MKSIIFPVTKRYNAQTRNTEVKKYRQQSRLNFIVCGTWSTSINKRTSMISVIMLMQLQWSLRFKTPLFNNSLHFKTGYQ